MITRRTNLLKGQWYDMRSFVFICIFKYVSDIYKIYIYIILYANFFDISLVNVDVVFFSNFS